MRHWSEDLKRLVPTSRNVPPVPSRAEHADYLPGRDAVPTDLPPPPNVWEKSFMALAAECGMAHSLTSAYERVAAYWRSQADMA